MRLFLYAGERGDFGADRTEPFGKIFVTAIDRIDIAQNRMSRGSEHSQKDDDSWAKGGWGDELRWMPVGGAFHKNAMSV